MGTEIERCSKVRGCDETWITQTSDQLKQVPFARRKLLWYIVSECPSVKSGSYLGISSIKLCRIRTRDDQGYEPPLKLDMSSFPFESKMLQKAKSISSRPIS